MATELKAEYERRLERAQVPALQRAKYLKWVQSYLDFCQNCELAPHLPTSVGPFLNHLLCQNQSVGQTSEAAAALRLLTRPVRGRGAGGPGPRGQLAGAEPPAQSQPLAQEAGRSFGAGTIGPLPAQAGQGAPPAKVPQAGRGASWQQEYRDLEAAIRMRNYSNKTLEAYRLWVAKFQAFVHSRPPGELGTQEVRGFLSELAVRHGVAASTQNQAFNSLLFFYRHVLGREFGQLDGVVRAKRHRYVPVVLSRAEVEAVLGQLEPPYRLVGLLLYGCGLRLAECVGLRVQ
ncbi:MAG TPA: site-specific integrase, partial [Candidatus Sulfotelmatobacter sp.]|nr:site-specific integrase [Candidatus Sulfotelmatobacter sp.]